MIRLLSALSFLLAIPVAAAQPCNPVIDGTYCASQPGRVAADPSPPSRGSMTPIQGLGGDLVGARDDPATLGAITFRSDGLACIGLLRRGNCK